MKTRHWIRKDSFDLRVSKLASLPEDSPGHIYNQFVARFPDDDRLQKFLKEKKVETKVYNPVPLHLQDRFRNLGYRAGNFPEAEVAALKSLALPIYPELETKRQSYVVECIREFYQTPSQKCENSRVKKTSL